MNLDYLKESFLSYLSEYNKFKGQQETQNDALDNFSDISFFIYQKEFKEYLVKEYGADSTIFSKSIFEIMQMEIQDGKLTQKDENEEEYSEKQNENSKTISDLTQQNQINILDEQKNFFEENEISYDSMEDINNFFADERIAGIFSTQEDGSLSLEDKMNALILINSLDGDETKISTDDITYFQKYVNSFYGEDNITFNSEINKKILSEIQGLDGNDVDISSLDFQELSKVMEKMQIKDETLDTEIPKEEIDEAAVIEANKIKNKNTHSSNYDGFDTSLKSYSTANDIKTIESQINSKREEITAQNNIKKEAMAQDKIYAEFMDALNSSNAKISEYEFNLTDLKANLHDTQYNLIAAQEQLNNLKDPVIFTEYQDEIDSLRESLQTQITTLTQTKETLENNISQTETALKDEQENDSKLKEQVEQYEANRPNNIVKQCNENISILEKDIADLESQKAQKQQELETQRTEELSDAEVFGKAQAYRQSEFTKFMLDYATNPETKKYYDDWYFKEWNGHSYCAIFTSNVSELMYAKVMEKLGLTKDDLRNLDGYGQLNNGAQGIKGNQMGMHAIQWGNEIQPALDALGINMNATIDITKMTTEERKNAVKNGLIYPGMTFEYKGDDGSYHTGFVESINKDLSWTTIEGNIDIKYEDGAYERHTVGSRTVDYTKNNLAHMTDSTAKALIWAYEKGVLTIEDINSMTYAGIFAS